MRRHSIKDIRPHSTMTTASYAGDGLRMLRNVKASNTRILSLVRFGSIHKQKIVLSVESIKIHYCNVQTLHTGTLVGIDSFEFVWCLRSFVLSFQTVLWGSKRSARQLGTEFLCHTCFESVQRSAVIGCITAIFSSFENIENVHTLLAFQSQVQDLEKQVTSSDVLSSRLCTLLCAWHSHPGWSHVQFLRDSSVLCRSKCQDMPGQKWL